MTREPPATTVSDRARRIVPVLVAFLLVLGVTADRLRHHRWDATSFIVLGRPFANPAELPAPVTISPDNGYDGQYFYRLALDPFVTRTEAFGVKLDSRPARVGRILYPAIAWALALGQPRWVPWTLILSNLAGLLIIAWVSTGIARRFGASAWFGLLPPAWPGFLLSISRDTAEIDAACFGLLAVSAALARRPARAALFGACAVLTRETTLFYLAGFGIAALFEAVRRRAWSNRIAFYAVPAVALALWQFAVLRITGGTVFTATGSIDLGTPFVGEFRYLSSHLLGVAHDLRAHRPPSLAYEKEVFEAISAAFCIAFPFLPLAVLGRRGTPPGLTLSWLAYLALATCFTSTIWVEPWGYLRILSDCFTVTAALLLTSRATAPRLALSAMTLPVWLGAAWYVWR